MKKDSLGDRMKKYEDVNRYFLPIKSYVMFRVDGKSFHTYTKGLKRPFDDELISDMNDTAIAILNEMSNVLFAYVQSDEISILMKEKNKETSPWFDNNIQKMVSVAASTATEAFNKMRILRKMEEYKSLTFLDAYDKIKKLKGAKFDTRTWVLPSKAEVMNYFIWRQQDATRNSISSVAQSLYSPKDLHGVSSDLKQELIFKKGINWNNYDSGKKRGRFIERVSYVNGVRSNIISMSEGGSQYLPVDDKSGKYQILGKDMTVRNRWEVVETPVFSQDKDFLINRIID